MNKKIWIVMFALLILSSLAYVRADFNVTDQFNNTYEDSEFNVTNATEITIEHTDTTTWFYRWWKNSVEVLSGWGENVYSLLFVWESDDAINIKGQYQDNLARDGLVAQWRMNSKPEGQKEVYSMCYQESANTTNQTGIDGNCELNYSGEYESYGTTVSEDAGVLINYTKPEFAINSKWLVKYGNDSRIENITIPTDCWNYNSDVLVLKMVSQVNGFTQISAPYCYNGTQFRLIGTESRKEGSTGVTSGGSFGFINDGNWNTYGFNYNQNPSVNIWTQQSSSSYGKFYEEAMYWNISSKEYSPNIITDTLGINNGTLSGRTFNDGTVSGGVTIEDGAMKGEGTADYISGTGDFSSLKTGNTLTGWFWINETQSQNFPTIINIGNSTDRIALSLRAGGERKFEYIMVSANSVVIQKRSNDVYTNNGWNYLTTTWNGSFAKIFLNGNEITSFALNTNNYTDMTIATGFQLMARSGSLVGTFVGSLDDTLIFNRALSQAEITQLYNQGRGQYSSVTNGLVAQYSGRDFAGTEATPTIIYDTNHLGDGKVLESLSFDNSGDVTIPTISLPTWTASTWVKPTDLDNSDYILSKWTSAGDKRSFAIRTSSATDKFAVATSPDGTSSGNTVLLGTTTIDGSSWYYVTVSYDGSNLRLYVNGNLENNATGITVNNNDSQIFLGKASFGDRLTGSLDDVRIYNRSLTEDEVLAIYNEGLGTEEIGVLYQSEEWNITVLDPNAPVIQASVNATILYAEGDKILLNTTVADKDLDKVWYSYNGTNTTITGALNNTLNQTIITSTRSALQVIVYANDTIGNLAYTTFNLIVDPTAPTINLSYPTALIDYGKLNGTLELNFTAIDTNLDSVWYDYIIEETLATPTSSSVTSFGSPADVIIRGANSISIPMGCKTNGQSNIISYFKSNMGIKSWAVNCTNSTGNHLIGEEGIADVIVLGELTQRTYITGATSGVYNISNITLSSKKNATLCADDTAGNELCQVIGWDYKVFENSRTYDTTTLSGSQEEYKFNLTYNSLFSGITTTMNYNGTNYTMSSSDSSYTREYLKNLTSPSVTSSENLTIYFIVTLTNSTGTYYVTTDTSSQTVNPFTIDDCSSYSQNLLNFTMYDENTLQKINGTININLEVYSYNTRDLVATYNNSFNYLSTGNTGICLGNLTQNYTIAYTIQHFGNETDYYKKYRTIQKMTISSTTLNQSLNLYNLRKDAGYPFKIVVVGNLLSVSGNADILVDVQRQYLSENLFRSIESAVTDSDGETIGHMIQNEQVYNFILSYYGETLGSFNNYRVQCENPSLYQCTITLNLASVTAGIPTFQDYGNVEQTFLYDNDTHTIYQTFTSTDGESKEVQQVVLKLDNYANTTICGTTTSGTSGTLTCVIPTIYQETAFYIDTYIDGEYVGTKLFSQGIEYDWMGADVLIILLMFTSLVLLFIGHPILIVIGAVLGLVLPVTLIYIASASFASIMGAVMYYVAVGVVVMIILRRKI